MDRQQLHNKGFQFWIQLVITVTHKRQVSWTQLFFKSRLQWLDVINGADASTNMLWASSDYWSASAQTYTMRCIMSAGQIGWFNREGGGVGTGGKYDQYWEPQVCNVRTKRWQFEVPKSLGRWSGPALIPSLPAHSSRVMRRLCGSSLSKWKSVSVLSSGKIKQRAQSPFPFTS